MFIQKLRSLTDNIKIYFQTSLKEWKSDKVFYGILFIWMVGGGLFIADFIYSYELLATDLKNGSASLSMMTSVHFIKNMKNGYFYPPILIVFLINGILSWYILNNFNPNKLRKIILIYLAISLFGLIIKFIPNPVELNMFGATILTCTHIIFTLFFIGTFAIQSQTIFAFWLLLFSFFRRKTENKPKKKNKINILFFIILIGSFFIVLKFPHYLANWDVLHGYGVMYRAETNR